MVIELTLFGFQVFSFTIRKYDALEELLTEVDNTGGSFERADEMPFGFALPVDDDEEDEEGSE